MKYPVAEGEDDVDEKDVDPIITQFEKAFEKQKPIIIFIYTDDMRKKYESKRKACEAYMNDVLCDAKVAEQLEKYVRIKINYKKIEDDNKLKREFKLKKSAPYVAFYDFTGDQYSKTSSSDVNYIINKLKGCINTNDKEIKKLEKKAEREKD